MLYITSGLVLITQTGSCKIRRQIRERDRQKERKGKKKERRKEREKDKKSYVCNKGT